jgi:hypothetical protein
VARLAQPSPRDDGLRCSAHGSPHPRAPPYCATPQGVVGLVFDAVIFSCLPNGISLVLSNKRCETTNRNRAFAELGLKAAISVNSFNELDKEKKGKIKLSELTRIFGSVEQVDQNQALMIAKTVFDHAKT